MAVDVRRVRTRRDLGRFVDFPLDLYEGNAYWVPPLRSDEMKTLRRDANPARAFCDAAYWLAYRDGKIVGRIAGILNRKFVELWKKRYARFGWIDFIDDHEVSEALVRTVEAWAAEQGMEGLHGPLGFTDLDREGMLIEGFDELATLATTYNYPYYVEHLERLGYEKDVDWLEYQLEVPPQVPDRLTRLRRLAERRGGLRLVQYPKAKMLLPHARPIFEMLNAVYGDLYGFVPLTDAQIDDYVKRFFGFIRPEFVHLVWDEEDRLAGFGITMPSLSKGLQRSKGRLLPWGWVHLLKAMRSPDVLDLYLVGARQDLQGKGVTAIIMEQSCRVALKYGIRYAETNPELETNRDVQTQWRFFETRQHKRRRCFLKRFEAVS